MPAREPVLAKEHAAAGAKWMEFAGWSLPLQYDTAAAEHMAARQGAALFDLAHMGKLLVEGPSALATLDKLLSNDLRRCTTGRAQYTMLTNEYGGVIDDLVVYRLSQDSFLLVVNAVNREQVFGWLSENKERETTVTDRTAETQLLSLQGPKAVHIAEKVLAEPLDDMRFFRFREMKLMGWHILISRTGYTGEDGFEIYCSPDNVRVFWQSICDRGRPYGLKPAGLAARDSLRLEARLPLYGHELSPERTPLEAGLERFVALDGRSFFGSDILRKQAEEGVQERLIGFCLEQRGIPRQGYAITDGKQKIGEVTSGAYSPVRKQGIGLGYVCTDAFAEDSLYVTIRGKSIAAQFVSGRFINDTQ